MSTEKIPSECKKIYEKYNNCLKVIRPDSPKLLCAFSGPCHNKKKYCSYQLAILKVCMKRVKYGDFF